MLARASLVSLVLLALEPVSALWPIPRQYSTGNTSLFISQNVAITYNGAPVCWLSSPNQPCRRYEAGFAAEDMLLTQPEQLVYTYDYEAGNIHDSRQIVQGGVSRAFAAIFQDGFVPWKLHRKNRLASFEPNLMRQTWVKTLAITQTGKDKAPGWWSKPEAAGGPVDESYNLTLSADGHAKLAAASAVGVLRGLETFVQLFYKHSSGTFWYTPLAPVSIQDAPKFPHRGILLDVARNWYDVKVILHTIDAMAWNKMNRLHLHITDSQSWPLEIPSMPEVAEKGAYRSDLTYGADDIDYVQRYALARGVEVILEIDMPGHIGSLSWSHPELIMAYDAFPYSWWCAEPPCGAFRLNNSAVDIFLGKLFADLLPRVAPYTTYFHTGGDELKANDSRLDPAVGTNASEVLQPMLQKFIDDNHRRIRKAGLTPMVWEEIPLQWNVTLGNDTVIQTWLSDDSVKTAVQNGYRVIDSNYNYWVSSFLPLPSPLPITHIKREKQRQREREREQRTKQTDAITKHSTSTAAAGSGYSGTTARPSIRGSPSTTGAGPRRTGCSSTRTTRRPACRTRRPRRCWAARWPCGARPSTPSTWTRSYGRGPAPPARCSGRAGSMRRARTAASSRWRRA